MTDASMAMPTRRVEMLYAGTAPQNRLTVAFRIILAIPQFIVLYFLFIAVFFVRGDRVVRRAVHGPAAPMGPHLPRAAWSAGPPASGAYMFLLTDRYPPFSFDDVEYPARPILPDRGPLNRVSVFFRIILAIPAGVFLEIVLNGLTFPLLLVMWFVVLVTGSMPPALYDRVRGLLRYQVRFHAWFVHAHLGVRLGHAGRPASRSDTGYTPPPFAAPGRRRSRRGRCPGRRHRPAAGAAVLVPVRTRSARRTRRTGAAGRAASDAGGGRRAARLTAGLAAAAAGPPGSPPGPCPRRRRGSARRRRPRRTRCRRWGTLDPGGCGRGPG